MKCPPRRFFWLLLWAGVIGLVAPMGWPSSGPIRRAKKVRTQAVIKDLEFALRGFHVEYGRYPLCGNKPQGNDGLTDTANSRLIDSLMGADSPDNPRAIMFLELPLAKNGMGGLTGEKGKYRLVDDWGHPFQITLDLDKDQSVANPDLQNAGETIRAGAAKKLALPFAIFSSGRDGIALTVDDITSWRAMPALSSNSFEWSGLLDWPFLMMMVCTVFSLVGAIGLFCVRARKGKSHIED